MKASTILSVAAACLLVAPARAFFYAVVGYSGSPIHNEPINAHDGRLWVGKPTTRYCPDEIKNKGGCPGGEGTAFTQCCNELSMAVKVPGGQRVSINPDTGVLSVTIPDGDGAGEIMDGWSHVKGEHTLSGELSWKWGMYACQNTQTPGEFQIFANVHGIVLGRPDSSLCLGPFSALTYPANGTQAWQYTSWH